MDNVSLVAQDNTLKPVSELFGALSHPTRLKLIGLLMRQEMDVSHLQAALGVSQSSVSQHLGLMKQHGLLQERRQGKHVFYSIRSPQIKAVIQSAIQLITINAVASSEAIETMSELLSCCGI